MVTDSVSIEYVNITEKQERYSICNKEHSLEEENNTREGNDENRVDLGVWQQKFGRSFAIWQFGRTFGLCRLSHFKVHFLLTFCLNVCDLSDG